LHPPARLAIFEDNQILHMKRWFTALLLWPALAFGNTSKDSVPYADSNLVFIDQLQPGSAYKVRITSYSCYSQSTIEIEIVRDCDGFNAVYNRMSKGTLTATLQETRTMRLTDRQLETIRDFERNMNSGTPSVEYCRNTTYYTVLLDHHTKAFRDTDCRVNRFVSMKNAFETESSNALTASAN
jgi:hypothetical protein